VCVCVCVSALSNRTMETQFIRVAVSVLPAADPFSLSSKTSFYLPRFDSEKAPMLFVVDLLGD